MHIYICLFIPLGYLSRHPASTSMAYDREHAVFVPTSSIEVVCWFKLAPAENTCSRAPRSRMRVPIHPSPDGGGGEDGGQRADTGGPTL